MFNDLLDSDTSLFERSTGTHFSSCFPPILHSSVTSLTRFFSNNNVMISFKFDLLSPAKNKNKVKKFLNMKALNLILI